MTFSDIVLAVQDRLNLTSQQSADRIGREVNDRHRRITSSLGMNITRRTTVQSTMVPGITTLAFAGEKIINIVDRSVNPYRVLKEISVEELRAQQPSPNTFCSYYCIVQVSWNSVTVEMDCVPQAPLLFYADVLQNAATLSGVMEPLFPESFHDVLFHGVLEDEYLKLEKLKLAQDSGLKYERRLSDLRFHFAKSSYIDWVQGKTRGTIYEEGVPGAGGGAGGTAAPAGSYTQTGLITFDGSGRTGNTVPFAVAPGNAPITGPQFIGPSAIVNPNDATKFLRGDGTFAFIGPSAIVNPNDVTKFLRGDGTFAALSQGPSPWTPTDASGAGLLFTGNASYYLKLGRLVWIVILFVYPATASVALSAVTLPFPVDANTQSALALGFSAAPTTITMCQILNTNSTAIFRASSGAQSTNANLSNQTIQAAGTYISLS